MADHSYSYGIIFVPFFLFLIVTIFSCISPKTAFADMMADSPVAFPKPVFNTHENPIRVYVFYINYRIR